jgi:hypothetical protein
MNCTIDGFDTFLKLIRSSHHHLARSALSSLIESALEGHDDEGSVISVEGSRASSKSAVHSVVSNFLVEVGGVLFAKALSLDVVFAPAGQSPDPRILSASPTDVSASATALLNRILSADLARR